MTLRSVAPLLVLALASCRGGGSAPGDRAPTTTVVHELSAQARLNDHAERLSGGIARWREVFPGTMPGTMRDLALTMAADCRPCFTEVLKDQWFQPYRYAPVSDGAGTFSLTSAGRDGKFGTSDDLSTTRGPGDASLETYGFTPHANE